MERNTFRYDIEKYKSFTVEFEGKNKPVSLIWNLWISIIMINRSFPDDALAIITHMTNLLEESIGISEGDISDINIAEYVGSEACSQLHIFTPNPFLNCHIQRIQKLIIFCIVYDYKLEIIREFCTELYDYLSRILDYIIMDSSNQPINQ